MIRNVVVHMVGEQPLIADLDALPTSADACLVCTNLRTVDGRKPRFIDDSGSTFLVPLVHVRFVELPGPARPADEPRDGDEPGTTVEDPLDLEPDQDFLRRIREA